MNGLLIPVRQTGGLFTVNGASWRWHLCLQYSGFIVMKHKQTVIYLQCCRSIPTIQSHVKNQISVSKQVTASVKYNSDTIKHISLQLIHNDMTCRCSKKTLKFLFPWILSPYIIVGRSPPYLEQDVSNLVAEFIVFISSQGAAAGKYFHSTILKTI